jgi:hypothetical protein
MQVEATRNETSTQEIDLADIFEIRALAKRTPSSIPPPLPAAALKLSLPVAPPVPTVTPAPPAPPPPLVPPAPASSTIEMAAVTDSSPLLEEIPAPPKSAPLPSFDECADVERVVLTRESASKLKVAPAGPVELPTLRRLKKLTKWSAMTILANETLRVPQMTLAQAASALRVKMSRLERNGAADDQTNDDAKTRIHLPSRARAIVARLRALPTPVWASVSAAAAALVVGLGALIAVGHGPQPEAKLETPAIEVKTPERTEPLAAVKALPARAEERKDAQLLRVSESTARWSDLPTLVIEPPAPAQLSAEVPAEAPAQNPPVP